MRVALRKSRHAPALQQRRQFLALLQRAQQLASAGSDAQNGVIQFILLGRREMIALNGLHLQHQGATDVITYDLRDNRLPEIPAEDDCVLAEIYLCPEVATEAAAEFQQSASRELVLYAVHGLLHLYGEDDLTTEQRASMRAAEKRILAALEQDFALHSVAEFCDLC